jgi:hypothetical protein
MQRRVYSVRSYAHRVGLHPITIYRQKLNGALPPNVTIVQRKPGARIYLVLEDDAPKEKRHVP